MTSLSSLVRSAAGSVPVDPDAPEAERLLRDELSKQEYLEAQPSPFDLLVQSLIEWFLGLFGGGTEPGGGAPGVGSGIIVSAVIALLIITFLIFGLPRLNRRSRVSGALFGADDDRSAAGIRKAAELAARAGDYSLAIAEMYRSIARGLAERTVVSTNPGTTAHDFADRAGIVFPDESDALRLAAIAFDDVRYLDVEGTKERFEHVAALESNLRSAKPVFATEVVS